MQPSRGQDQGSTADGGAVAAIAAYYWYSETFNGGVRMCRNDMGRRSFVGQTLGSAAILAGLPRAFRVPLFEEVAQAERPHLAVALEAWRWIETTRQETLHGVTWPADPTEPDSIGTSLYTHGPGVLPFALELFHVTGDERFLVEAQLGTDHILAGSEQLAAAGFYTGLAGLAFVAEETYRASGRETYRHGAERLTDRLVREAAAVGAGKAWPLPGDGSETIESNDIVSGTAGTGLALLYLAERLENHDALNTAVQAGHRLIERAIPVDAGAKWEIWPGYATEMPNFSHGTAGVAYFLATLYQRTGDGAFLDAALQGAEYLRSIATQERGGYRMLHHQPGGEDLFYLGWCHGPVGTNRLFHAIGEATGDPSWREWMHMGARGMMGTGVPERRTPGFWENISQCGGTAGMGEFFLSFYRMTGDERYRAFVQRLNDDLLRRGDKSAEGTRWIQAEHRVRPELLVAQTGFMQGAAGVGKYFLHMDSMETSGSAPAVIFPDAPY